MVEQSVSKFSEFWNTARRKQTILLTKSADKSHSILPGFKASDLALHNLLYVTMHLFFRTRFQECLARILKFLLFTKQKNR